MSIPHNDCGAILTSFFMTIDKSWTTISNRNSTDILQETGLIQTLWAYIHEYGFVSTYTTWNKHGEPHPPPPPPLLVNTPQPPSPEYNEMATFLNDIHSDNEPTQPTQTTVPEPTQTTDPQPTKTAGPDRVNEFEKLFGRAADNLFPDCDWMTSLDFMARMSHAKEAREKPPPDDWKRSAEEWQELIDFWADPKRMNIAKKNDQNRAKKKTTSHQGSKSFAQGRHEF
ncbi:retrovirus-related pol polyprotein from transposon TNT 1-94, partial [Tanacetum coccineum]